MAKPLSLTAVTVLTVALTPLTFGPLARADAPAGPPRSADTAVPVVRVSSAMRVPAVANDLAPRLRLFPGEDLNPLSALTFLEHSALQWAHDGGCGDETPASTGNISNSGLGSGNYVNREKDSRLNGCDDFGPEWRSNQEAAPHNDDDLDGDAEGWFLQLEDAYRDGQGFDNTEPVYVRFSSGNWIQFWFHYGASNIIGLSAIRHEGDWEHISIRLSSSNAPLEVEYSYHREKCTLSWADAPKNNGRPVIWVAHEAHGSYPAGADPKWYDNISGNGELWTTSNNVDMLKDHTWYGFGGAWGEVGTNNDTTGPVGPWPDRAGPSFDASTCDMN